MGVTLSESDFSNYFGIVKFEGLCFLGKVTMVSFWYSVMVAVLPQHTPRWAAAHLLLDMGCACHTNIRNQLWLMTTAAYVL